MAMTFSGGTSARTLCTCWKTNPPPRAENRHLLANVAADLRRRGLGESTKRVSQPPPQKVSLPPKSAFSARGVHARAGDLHRIDGVQAGVDQVGQQRPHAAAAVEHHLDVGQFLGARATCGRGAA